MAEPAKVYHLPTKPRRNVNVNSWRWNELEEDVIDALPLPAQIIYLRVMRKHMDYETGIVGIKRFISYDQIRERLEYQPPRNSSEKVEEFSVQRIKRLIQKIVDAGLAERLHDTSKGVARMAFRLPLACCDQSELRHESDTGTATRHEPHNQEPETYNTDTRATRGPRHTSGSVNPFTSPNGEVVATSAPRKTKAKKWGEEIDHELAEQMFAAVSADLTNPKRPNMDSWANDIRLLRERDSRTAEQIRFLITWTAKHHFWSTVVLSPSKLRAKWDQLEIQVKKLKESRHANRQGSSAQRTDRDVIASRLADPNDSDWIDGLFDEDRPAQGTGEPDIHSTGSDLPPDMANGFHDAGDALAGEAGGSYIDGEVVGTTYEPCGGHGAGADQSRGRRVAPERSAADQEPAAKAGGFWNA